jgi:hypothetical protein
VFVVVATAMILASWGLANRQTVALVRLKEHLTARESSRVASQARRLALGYGLALLETGEPPVEEGESSYECEALVLDDLGAVRAYIVRFELISAGRWRVSARVRDASESGTWPHPDRFPPPTTTEAARREAPWQRRYAL